MLKFYIKETFKSFSKAKLSTFFSFVTTSIAIILIITSLSLIIFSDVLKTNIIDRMTINLFLEESINELQLNEILSELNGLQFQKRLKYISKAAAEEVFLKQTGEDFKKILEYNPLPASIELNIRPEYYDKLEQITSQLKRIDGVDEVYSQNDFIQTLINVLTDLKYYLVIAAFILILISFYLVYSTDRIILQTKMRQIETMKLVGAHLRTIKIPIILNGLLIGVLSALLVISIVAYLISLGKNYYTINFTSIVDHALLYIFILLCGILIGTLGSYLAVRKVSLKVSKIMF